MAREESRWTYVPGSRPEGVIVYDDGAKLHSHHDTDPATPIPPKTPEPRFAAPVAMSS